MPRGAAHVLPYVLFVTLGAAGALLPEGLRPWADPVRACATAGVLVAFARRGAYPELAGSAPRRRGATLLAGAAPTRFGAALLAVGAGLAAALLWIPMAEAVPALGSRGGFDPLAAGASAAPVLWAGRLVGSVAVVPFAEELLVRSFLPRWVDDPDGWAGRAVGTFTARSAALSIGFFTLTHPEWLAALVTGCLWTGLLAATGRLRDAVLAHAVANGLLAAWVVGTGDFRWW